MARTDAQQQNAWQILVDQLTAWGIIDRANDSNLAKWLWNQMQNNVPDQLIMAKLRDTDEYKQRFKAMPYFVQNQGAISEAEYIKMEREYRDSMSLLGGTYKGFMTNDYIAQLMMNGISKDEVVARVNAAVDYIVYDAPGSVKQALRDEYGMTDMEMVAYMLDPKALSTELENRYNRSRARAIVTGAARDVGIAVNDTQRQQIADLGMEYGQASAAFLAALAEADQYRSLGDYSGEDFSSSDAIADSFNLEGANTAKQKKRRLASQERARFGGSSGLGARSLAAGGLGSQ